MDEILEITLFIAEVYDQQCIPYLIGGSLASSVHGIPRATQDVDIVAAMHESHVSGFAASLRGQFSLDVDAIRDAVRRHASFNVVHLDSYFKADVFVAADDEPSRLQMERRQRLRIGHQARELVVASPEDVVAQKLYWHSFGDGVSERQWNDAIGVRKVGGNALELYYLRTVGQNDLTEIASLIAAVDRGLCDLAVVGTETFLSNADHPTPLSEA